MNRTSLIAEVYKIQPRMTSKLCAKGVEFTGYFEYIKYENISNYVPLSIIVPDDFPKTEPTVRLLEEIFPFDIEHHIYSTGVCCITVWEHWKVFNDNTTITNFLETAVRQFFIGQAYYKDKSRWPFGEWEHGLDGLIQAYAEILNVKPTIRHVRKKLISIMNNNILHKNISAISAKEIFEKLGKLEKKQSKELEKYRIKHEIMKIIQNQKK